MTGAKSQDTGRCPDLELPVRTQAASALVVGLAYIFVVAPPVTNVLDAARGGVHIALGLVLIFGQALLLDSCVTSLSRALCRFRS